MAATAQRSTYNFSIDTTMEDKIPANHKHVTLRWRHILLVQPVRACASPATITRLTLGKSVVFINSATSSSWHPFAALRSRAQCLPRELRHPTEHRLLTLRVFVRTQAGRVSLCARRSSGPGSCL